MFNIYILKCNNNKYYVGKTKNNINKRLRQRRFIMDKKI